MPIQIDLTGKIFGRWTVIKIDGQDKRKSYLWLCRCECGKEKTIVGYSLRRGDTKSCGCLRKELTSQRFTKHGHRKFNKATHIYQIWLSMKQRCTNPNDKDYCNYGDRGITVCKRWMKFPNFLKDMGEPPTNKHQIDRINNNRGYKPSNCRWATHIQQQRNSRNNNLIEYNGKIKCLVEWSKEYNINYHALWKRIYKYHWSIEEALTTPVRKGRKKK